MPVTGIVLAGGESRRFGSDKLVAALDGVALVDRAARAVAAVCAETILVVPPRGVGRAAPPRVLAGVRVVEDPEPFGGPLVGLVTGLRTATFDLALVVAGDMPWLEPSVLAHLVEALDAAAEGVDSAALQGSDGAPERLPLAVRVAPGLARGEALLARGERRLRRLWEELSGVTVDVAAWTALDPAARTPLDVDVPDDLERA